MWPIEALHKWEIGFCIQQFNSIAEDFTVRQCGVSIDI